MISWKLGRWQKLQVRNIFFKYKHVKLSVILSVSMSSGSLSVIGISCSSMNTSGALVEPWPGVPPGLCLRDRSFSLEPLEVPALWKRSSLLQRRASRALWLVPASPGKTTDQQRTHRYKPATSQLIQPERTRSLVWRSRCGVDVTWRQWRTRTRRNWTDLLYSDLRGVWEDRQWQTNISLHEITISFR